MLRVAPLVLLLSLSAWGHGSTVDPPPEDPPPPPMPERPPPPPPPPPPPTFDPGRTPTDPQAPPPPTANPQQPSIRPPVRTRRTSGVSSSWRIWWEYNREELLGLRGRIRATEATTEGGGGAPGDLLGAHRPKALEALRLVALRESDRTLRAAALIALGRMGEDEDARIFLHLLRRGGDPDEVLEGAAVALGILPRVVDGETAAATRAWLEYAVANRGVLPHRARGLAIAAAGLRAQRDRLLLPLLLERASARGADADEAALLSIACGYATDPLVAPEIVRAVRRSEMGGSELSDGIRSQAVYALAHCGQPGAGPALRFALGSRRAGIETRRAAALGLGRLLRLGLLSGDDLEKAPLELLRMWRDTNDAVLKGFCAVALGSTSLPAAIEELSASIDHGGNAGAKPYAALGLALMARRGDGDATATRIRDFLAEELAKTNDPDLGSALSIAVGLAGGTGGRDPLLDRLGHKAFPDEVRGAAAEGLGILGDEAPPVLKALRAALDPGESAALTGDAALALGLLGQRSVARELLPLLRASTSEAVQGRILLALGHLSNRETAEPLIGIVRDPTEKPIVREYAAVALGMLGDARDRDLLFSLDADFNYFATVSASRELIRLY
jgi:HEAT repeat protein